MANIIEITERRPELRDAEEICSGARRVPMSHGVDSLNVAAASAGAFYQPGQ